MEKELYEELNAYEITKLNEKAENAVMVAVAITSATGAVPIPFADAPLLIGEQVTLMATICGIYGIDVEKDGLKMLAVTVLGTGGATIVGKTIATNLLKLIPVAGTAVGGAISAGTAGVVTLAMGEAFIEVCKAVKLGKLSESDLISAKGTSMMKDQFKEQIKKTVEKTYGIIHKTAAAEMHGTKGYLYWDYVLYNEITFKDINGKIVSLYTSFSDKKTENAWNELVKKYGV